MGTFSSSVLLLVVLIVGVTSTSRQICFKDQQECYTLIQSFVSDDEIHDGVVAEVDAIFLEKSNITSAFNTLFAAHVISIQDLKGHHSNYAALRLYTDPCCYSEINRSLRVKPVDPKWKYTILSISSALNHMEPQPAIVVKGGTLPEGIISKFNVSIGDTIDEYTFWSTTKQLHIAITFTKFRGDRRILWVIDQHSGRYVVPFSRFPNEEEVLIGPGSHHQLLHFGYDYALRSWVCFLYETTYRSALDGSNLESQVALMNTTLKKMKQEELGYLNTRQDQKVIKDRIHNQIPGSVKFHTQKNSDQVPKEWKCDTSYYAAFDGCDCGCGVWDPDCDIDGEKLFNCQGPSPHCVADTAECGFLNPPSQWKCDHSFFNSSDGCDSECGAFDPDCLLPEEPLCTDGKCTPIP